jgi:hypothetical protein
MRSDMRYASLLLLVVSATSCASDPPTSPPPAQAPAALPAAAKDPGAATLPLSVVVTGPSVPPARGGVFDVEIVISRRTPDSVPIALQATVPPGVRIVAGDAVESIVDDQYEVLRRKLTLQLDELPAGDLLISLDTNRAGSGAHATSAYRFGRPEPSLPAAPHGTPLIVNGRYAGQPVPLSPPTHPR